MILIIHLVIAQEWPPESMKLEVCLGLIDNLLVMIGEQFPFVERKFNLSV